MSEISGSPAADASRPANTLGATYYLAPLLGLAVGTLICLTFLVPTLRWLPEWITGTLQIPRRLLLGWLNAIVGRKVHGAWEWVHGSYMLVVGVALPWITMTLVGRGRPSVLGVRVPNRYGVRVLVTAYVLSIPFLYWMISSTGMPRGYLPHYHRVGMLAFLAYYLANMVGEHFLLHGVVLAMMRPGWRWPRVHATDAECASISITAHHLPVLPDALSSSSAGASPSHGGADRSGFVQPEEAYSSSDSSGNRAAVSWFTRALRWIGLAQPCDLSQCDSWGHEHCCDKRTEHQVDPLPDTPEPKDSACAMSPEDVRRAESKRQREVTPPARSGWARWNAIRIWIGLPRACAFGVIGSALLFGLVHVGKDPREMMLSFPGGVILAYLAYRTNSFLTPFLLHLATAATAMAMMVALE